MLKGTGCQWLAIIIDFLAVPLGVMDVMYKHSHHSVMLSLIHSTGILFMRRHGLQNWPALKRLNISIFEVHYFTCKNWNFSSKGTQ